MTRGALAAAIGILTCVRPALAEEPGCNAESKHPWVALASDPSLGAGDAERVRRELHADLASQAIDVCDAARAGVPIARIVLSALPGAEVSIRVEIHDALTQKEVARTLGTSNIPADGRALAIALAAGELLRASWSELALRAAPPPAMPIPPPVSRLVNESMVRVLVPTAPHIVGLGIALAGEAFTSGFVRLGADARLSVDVGSRFTASGRVGFRRALSTTTVDGTVDADALVLGGDAAFAFLPHWRAWNVELLARVDVVPISFHATAALGATASTATLVSVEASGGARGRVWLSPTFGFFVEAGLGGSVVSATAKDNGVTIASTTGLLVFAAVSANGKF